MAAHTVTKANEDMGGTVVKSDSDAIEYKPQPPSKSAVKPLSDVGSKIEITLADHGVCRKLPDQMDQFATVAALQG